MSTRYFVQVTDAGGALQKLPLALDDKGKPQFSASVMAPIRPMFQAGEPGYAHFAPTIQGVYAQGDLSDGMGKKLQVPGDHQHGRRYYYADGIDASVAGQIQRGPLVNTITAPANSGTLNGHFVLASTLYLVLGRIIVSWALSTDTVTSVKDLGAGAVGSSGAVFMVLGTEAAIETQTTDDTNGTALTSADILIAQSFRSNTAGVLYISRVDVKLLAVGTPTGDVRLRIAQDLNGRPDLGHVISTSRMLAVTVPTTAGGTVMQFRFDDDDSIAMAYNEPMWLILDHATGSAANYVSWRYKGTASSYARGTYSQSNDSGNSWGDNTSLDSYFNVFAKTPTATGFVGDDSTTNAFLTTTDGTTYTADTYRYSSVFCTMGDRIGRDVRAVGTRGCIQWSTDGANWSEVTPIGDPTTQTNWLGAVGNALIVVKTDSIWAVDFFASSTTDVTPFAELLYQGSPVSTNGQGSCSWRGAAYIPFDSRLMAVTGSSDGWTVHESVGVDSLAEWDAPWGTGRHLACAGSRFHLYSIVSVGTSSPRLLKAANPLRKNADGTANPDWHGSLAMIGTGAQTNQYMAIYDAGGTASPELFVTTTGNDLARIRLPRTFNPANDPQYRYNNVALGNLYFPWATGNFFVNPKSWLTEPVAFHTTRASDYVQVSYDTQDGLGWQLCNDDDQGGGGRLYKTGVLKYPRGTSSVVLARVFQMVNSGTTVSPIILASAVTYAMRPLTTSPVQELTFVVDAEENLSGADLGDMLGIGADTIKALLLGAAVGGNTRTVIGPSGETYYNVLFLDAKRVFLGQTQGGPRSAIEVNAVSVP